MRTYTGCPRRNVQDFGRVFLMLNYTDITQNTYIQSWTVTEIMASEVWNFDSCYSLIDYQIHIETGRNMWFLVSVMLIAVRNIKVTCEWHKAMKLNYRNTRTHVIVVLRLPSTLCRPQLICYLVTSELPTDCSAQAKVTALSCLVVRQAHWTSMMSRTAYSTSTPMKPTLFSGHYLRNRSTLDIGVLGYIGIV